jgi:hypothetical protein
MRIEQHEWGKKQREREGKRVSGNEKGQPEKKREREEQVLP